MALKEFFPKLEDAVKRCSLILVAVLVPLISRAANDPGAELKRHFDAAKATLAANDLLQAETDYRQTIALGLRQLANLSMSEGRFEDATRLLADALKLQPDDLPIRVDAAVAWFRRGEQDKAAELIVAALAKWPNDPQAHNLMGRIYLLNGDYSQAIQELGTALSLKPEFETAYFLGIAYLKARRLPEATALFRKLGSQLEESAALHVLFGRAYTLANFPEPAIAEFHAALKLNPKYPRAHGLLGYAYLDQLGEQAYPQAREEFEKELKFHPNQYYFLTLLGIATVALRDFPAAEAALLKAARLRPDDAPPYLYLGETYTETNRIPEAVEALQKYLRLVHMTDNVMREISRAYYLLGQDLLRLGRAAEAKNALDRSRQVREAKFRYDQQTIFGDKQTPSADGESHTSDRVEGLLESGAPEEKQATQTMLQEGVPPPPGAGPSPPENESIDARQYRAFAAEILASSYNDLGVMRAKDSKFGEAAEFFKQAAIWKPDLSGLDRNWGLASFRAQRYAEAIPPLERQLASHPDDAFVRQLLGLSHFFTDNFAKASEVLQPFAAKPPSDPGLLYAWGVSLVRTKHSADAARIFRILLEQNAANPEVRFLLGQAYAQQEDYPDALNELKAALQLNPRLPEVHYYSGLVLLHQGDLDAAAQEFLAELELRPGDPVTTYHLGFTLLSQGKAPEAAALFRQALKARPDYELAHFELGRALLQTGDDTGAIESLETAKKLAPDRDATWYQLSQAYRRAGRQQEAQQALVTYQKLIEESRLKKRKFLEADQP